MYDRQLKAPTSGAYFLFGPRGTGKTTWLKQHFSNAYLIDLLPAAKFLRYEGNPDILTSQVLALPRGQTVVIDEIQRAPSLLNEIHALIENHGRKNFILTGSSARKLRKGAANLLAGRARTINLFPLTAAETRFELKPEQHVLYGSLPSSALAASDSDRAEFLEAYVSTYLDQEIRSESLVRNVGSFTRFLEVASLAAGTSINVSSLSRDAGVGRETVKSYFSILEDTLLASWLPAYRSRAKVKEVAAPKFYWFDSGVLNAAAGGFRQPLPQDWRGRLFEHWVLQELRAHMAYHKLPGSLGFWGTPSASEIDFIYWHGDKIVAIEVKATGRMRPEYLSGIAAFSKSKKLKASYVVTLGTEELLVDGTRVMPVMKFLKSLAAGQVVG